MTKEKIRAELLTKRRKLEKRIVLEKSKKIEKKLFTTNEFKKAAIIMFYISYNNEVFTHDMIKKCLKTSKKIIVPAVNKEKNKLILSELISWDHLEKGAYNILEPKKKFIKETSIDEIDLIIVPGLGFDLKGNRIGHGKGFYDRLLRIPKVKKIGLAFEWQIFDEIPTDNHDIPINMIISEKRIISCLR